MTLYDNLLVALPELTSEDFGSNNEGLIQLKNDGDGIDYIARWDYEQPIPDGYKLGK